MIDQTDEEVLRNEVSDEALEAAALAVIGRFPTLPNTYCFACPSILALFSFDPAEDLASADNQKDKTSNSTGHLLRDRCLLRSLGSLGRTNFELPP